MPWRLHGTWCKYDKSIRGAFHSRILFFNFLFFVVWVRVNCRVAESTISPTLPALRGWKTERLDICCPFPAVNSVASWLIFSRKINDVWPAPLMIIHIVWRYKIINNNYFIVSYLLLTIFVFFFLLKGCYSRIIEYFHSHMEIVIGVGVGLGVTQILGIVFAFCLCQAIDNDFIK